MAEGKSMSIRVLVVDDQSLIREGLAIILDTQPDIEVVGQAGDGREAVKLAGQLAPDVILMDIRMPLMDGIKATRQILESHPQIKVLILTTYNEDDLVFDGFRAGAIGCSRPGGWCTWPTASSWTSRPVNWSNRWASRQ